MFRLVYWSLLRFHFHTSNAFNCSSRRSLSTETATEDIEDEGEGEEADDDHADRAATSKPSSMRMLDVGTKGDQDLEASEAKGNEDGGSSVIAEKSSARVGLSAEDDDAGGVGERASKAGGAIRSSFRGKVGGVNGGSRGGDEVEEDSAEEGAVDEHVDDLTFFDDATQPEGTDPDWDTC